nr:hypothetical protein [uncultured Victivallis sp.]
MVDRDEMVPVPFEIGIFLVAARKPEVRVRFDLPAPLPDLLFAIVGLVLFGHRLFGFVPAHPVIQDDIGVDLQAVPVAGPDCGKQLLQGPVLGRDGAFLVEFAEIIQVIDRITDVLRSGISLVTGRNPDARDSRRSQLRRLLLQLLPQHSGRQIPFEKLHHRTVSAHVLLLMAFSEPDALHFIRIRWFSVPMIITIPEGKNNSNAFFVKKVY